MKILICESDVQSLGFLRIVLKEMNLSGLEIFEFRSEKEAISAFEKDPASFSLLLIRFNIFKKEGISLLGPKLGEGVALLKPFSKEDFKNAIKKFLSNGRFS